MAPFLASRTSSSFRVTTDKAAGSKLDAAKISLSWTKLINTISFCENNYLSIFLFEWICQSNNFSFQKKFFEVCFLDNFLNSCDKVSMKFIPFGLKFLESLFQNLNIQYIILFVGGGLSMRRRLPHAPIWALSFLLFEQPDVSVNSWDISCPFRNLPIVSLIHHSFHVPFGAVPSTCGFDSKNKVIFLKYFYGFLPWPLQFLSRVFLLSFSFLQFVPWVS